MTRRGVLLGVVVAGIAAAGLGWRALQHPAEKPPVAAEGPADGSLQDYLDPDAPVAAAAKPADQTLEPQDSGEWTDPDAGSPVAEGRTAASDTADEPAGSADPAEPAVEPGEDIVGTPAGDSTLPEAMDTGPLMDPDVEEVAPQGADQAPPLDTGPASDPDSPAQ